MNIVAHGLTFPSPPRRLRYVAGDEAKLQGAVVTLARSLGWKTFHMYDAQKSEPGQPDLQLRRPPRLVFAELKTDYGRLRPDQKRVLRDLALCGVEVYVWRDRMYPRPIMVVLGPGYVCAHNYKLVRGGGMEACEVCGRCRGLEEYR